MAAKKGSLQRLYVGNGGSPETFTLVAGIRSTSWRFGLEPIETTTQDDIDNSGASYRTFLPGIASGGGPIEGVSKDASIQGFVADALAGTYRNYKIEIPNFGDVTASMFFANVEFQGPFDGVATFSAELVLGSAPTIALTTATPVNALLPSISGTPQVGVVLTASEGAWTGGGGLAFTYQWQELISSTWTNISGATARTYTPVAGSVGRALRVRVTATNASGGVTANSGPTAAVLAA